MPTLLYVIGDKNEINNNIKAIFILLDNLQTLGNHEFDHGVEGVTPFVDAIKAPLTLANVDVSLEPSLQEKLRKSIILTRGERRIGVIGVINRFTPVIEFFS